MVTGETTNSSSSSNSTLLILLATLVLKSSMKIENKMFLQTPGLLKLYMTSLKKIKTIKYRHQQCIASVCVTAYIMSFLISRNLKKSTASKILHSSNLAPSFKWVVQKSNISYTFPANFVWKSTSGIWGWAMLCHSRTIYTYCLVLELTWLCNCTNLFDFLPIMSMLRTLTQIK